MKATNKTPALQPHRSLLCFNGQFALSTRAHGAEQTKFLSPAAVLEAFRHAPVDSGWLAPGIVRATAARLRSRSPAHAARRSRRQTVNYRHAKRRGRERKRHVRAND